MNEKYFYYYLIPTDNRLEKSLRYTIQNEELIKKYINTDFHYHYNDIIRRFLHNNNIFKYKYIFICLYKYKNFILDWAWNPYHGSLKDETFEEKNATFKGCVNIEDFEIEAEKYNL